MSNPKLKGQRLGQVVYNAIHRSGNVCDGENCDDYIGAALFYIEDEYLVKLINDYLKEQ